MLSYTDAIEFMDMSIKNKMVYKKLAKLFTFSFYLGLSSLLALFMLIPLTTVRPQKAHAATPPAYAWTKTFDTTEGDADSNSVATDANGNVYQAGYFRGTVIFDGTGGSDSQTAAGSNGNSDAFLTEYNANGSYTWTKTFDTTNGSADGTSVATDTNGNVYLTGQFSGTVIFDGTGGSDSQTDAGGNGDAFLTKYNANGSYAWTKTFDTTDGYAYGNSVTTDANGNVYLTGYFSGTVVFDGAGGSDSQTAAGSNGDAFLTKYNANGSYAWTKTFDTTNGYAGGCSVVADTDGNVYQAGYFSGTVIFDGTGGSDSQTDAGGNGDAFLTKYNTNGSYAWTKTFDTTDGYAYGNSVTTDTDGNIYLVGQFGNTVVFGDSDSQTDAGGWDDTFLTKYNTNGSYAWTKTFDATNGDAYGNSVTTDTNDNIYLTGNFDNTVVFGDSDSQTDASGNSDAFLTKYNANGSYAWTKTFDTTDGYAYGKSVTTDTDGNIYLAGYFSGTVIFDGTGGSDSQTAGAVVDDDTFLTKYVLGSTQENNSGNNINPTSSSTPTAPNTGFGVFTTSPLHILAIYGLVSLIIAVPAIVSHKFAKR